MRPTAPELPAALAIVRSPDPARHTDAAVLDACAVVLSGTRCGVERDMAALLQRVIRPAGCGGAVEARH